MPVALDTRDSERGGDGEILREGDRADIRQVLAAQDYGFPQAATPRDLTGVHDAFEHAFAIFVARTRVPELQRRRETGQRRVALIDDDGWPIRPLRRRVSNGRCERDV